jgi:hypothetical protein
MARSFSRGLQGAFCLNSGVANFSLLSEERWIEFVAAGFQPAFKFKQKLFWWLNAGWKPAATSTTRRESPKYGFDQNLLRCLRAQFSHSNSLKCPAAESECHGDEHHTNQQQSGICQRQKPGLLHKPRCPRIREKTDCAVGK